MQVLSCILYLVAAHGSDIPALGEQLAILGSTGKAKQAISVQVTHDDVKRLIDKHVQKYNKRYESFVGDFVLKL